MYLLLKFVHLLAVILFLGNIITGLFWHAHATRTHDPKLLAHAMAGIIRSDRYFTIPGVLLIVAAGIGLAILGHFPILRTGWILWTLILFAISGFLFGWRVAPLQKQLHLLAISGTDTGVFDYQQYHRLAVRWELWGAAALLMPMLGMGLMVLKPGL